MRRVQQLKEHLKEANLRIHETELERDKAIDKIKQLQKQLKHQTDTYSSRESLVSISSRDGSNVHGALPRGTRSRSCSSRSTVDSKQIVQKSSRTSTFTKETAVEERKIATLPRASGMDVIKEIRISTRTSINSVPSDIGKIINMHLIFLWYMLYILGQNLTMEDEEDDFNNKYLSDLKEGRCIMPAKQESNVGRISELAWRNSLCPPHLKSSYPAELQFASPTRYKEDDIKVSFIKKTIYCVFSIFLNHHEDTYESAPE